MTNLPPTVSYRRRSSAGFTLVEIVVVSFLMVILASYAFISARVIFDRMHVDRASSRLAFQLQQARARAISTNQNIFVHLDAATNRFAHWVEPGGDGKTVPADAEWVEIGDPKKVKIDTKWTNGLFNAYGQFITTPGQREMKTVSTVFHSTQANLRSVELILRGSGAVTKR